MAKRIPKRNDHAKPTAKCPTGITGLDEITGGGVPKERATLVCGGPGCGKTILGMEFLVSGASQHGEPGVFVSFEETAEGLEKDFSGLSFDWNGLISQGKIAVNSFRIDRSRIFETGEYNLEGLFLRLAHSIDSVGAKRIVLDTPDALFAYFERPSLVRAELLRLLQWLQEKGLTALITGEGGNNALSRHGFEEFVVDCVLVLDHRVVDQISTRRIRIVKYRGSAHGLDEYPFLIDQDGISVFPISSTGLDYEVSTERVSTGINRLDTMLGGKGYYRDSTVLISGTAGTGKTSLSASFADAACRRGEKVLFLAFEESGPQIMRNVRSIGMDLEQWTKRGLLRFRSARPTFFGLEVHLATIFKMVDEFAPTSVVVDPVSNLVAVGRLSEVKALFIRLIGFLKQRHITGLFTNLSSGDLLQDQTDLGVSSLMDTWIVLKDIEKEGETNRTLKIIKSRGMEHSNQLREFLLTSAGIDLLDVFLGEGRWVMGTARASEEARQRAEDVARTREMERRRREMERERKAFKAQIALLEAQFEAKEEEYSRWREEEKSKSKVVKSERSKRGRMRGGGS